MGIEWRCVLWLIAWLLFLHLLFSLLPILRSLPVFVTVSLSVGMTALLSAAVYVPVIRVWRAEMAAETSGELRPNRKGNNNDVMVQIGGDGTRFRADSTDFTPFGILGDKFRVRRESGMLKVSTVVRNRNDNLIAEIVDNKWTVSSSCWDKNYNQDTLEVKDSRGRIVLQLRVLPDVVQVEGEWNTRNGGARIYNVIYQGTRASSISNFIPADQEPQFLQPIFLYPSKEHWAQLAPRQP